jgi:AcrR family transcriptional regulator
VTPPGLRERKKEQTRQRIADVALDLFARHGFKAITVIDVARAADVSEATVFNHFPNKEDLVLGGMNRFAATFIDELRRRPPGTSVAEAFGSFVLQPRGVLASDDPAVAARVATVSRLIDETPALQAREHRAFDLAADGLADLIREETNAEPDDITPWVVAYALVGIIRAISRAVRAHAVAEQLGPEVADGILAQARHALDRLKPVVSP